MKWSDIRTIYDLSIAAEAVPAGPIESQWQGNGSLISKFSGDLTGYGIDKDVSRIHPGNENPVAFFQWEIDSADGKRLQISGGAEATITYGSWSSRSEDRVYKNVALPFVLDPAADDKTTNDGSYYVVSVQYHGAPHSPTNVNATATNDPATEATSEAAATINVDGAAWHGNASVISHSSGDKTGYGLNFDIANIHPDGEKNPMVFFQWEVSAADGKTLEISAEGMPSATITYGAWSNRGDDVTKTVDLPYTIDPTADGKSANDGDWYVIKVAFPNKPSATTRVWAKTPNAMP
jgi:hypothetical protein